MENLTKLACKMETIYEISMQKTDNIHQKLLSLLYCTQLYLKKVMPPVSDLFKNSQKEENYRVNLRACNYGLQLGDTS